MAGFRTTRPWALVSSRVEYAHFTDEQVIDHLVGAIALVAELDPPEDLRVAVFDHACRMLSSKQVAITAPAPVGIDLSQLRGNG